MDKAPLLDRPSHGKLKLANSSWCVWTAQKTVGKRIGKVLPTKRTCPYSHQLFHVSTGKLISDTWMIGKHVLITTNHPKHSLYSHDLFICVRLHKRVALVKMNMRLLLNLLKRFTIVQLCRMFHLQHTNLFKTKENGGLIRQTGFLSFYFSTPFCFFSSLLLFHSSMWVALHSQHR